MRLLPSVVLISSFSLAQEPLATAEAQGVKAKLLHLEFQTGGAVGTLQITAAERDVRAFRVVLVSSKDAASAGGRVATWDWEGSLQAGHSIEVELKSPDLGVAPPGSHLRMSFIESKLDLGLTPAELAEWKRFSPRIQKAIKERKVVMGMTARQLELSWGKPESINSTVLPSHRMDQWVYGLGTYVYLQNGKVSSWQTSQ